MEEMDPAIAFYFKNNEDTESSSDSEVETTVNSIVISCSVLADKRKVLRKDCLLKDIEQCSQKEFQQDFRIIREVFNWLLPKIENGLKKCRVGPDTVLPKLQLLATIWILGTPDSYRSVAKQFGMSRSTVYKCVRRGWPLRRKLHWGNIPGVVGAVDGTFIPIKAPMQNPEAYNNRKCFHSITLQAICDHQRRFTDVFVGYPSSVGDASIFRNSNFFKEVTSNTEDFFSVNEIILGDEAYPLLRWCIPPYIDRGNLGRQEVNFNKMHAKTSQVIERAFALLFGRFRRLKYLNVSGTDLVPEVVLACCILHNLCLMFPDELLENYEAEGQNFVVENENNADVNAREAIDVLTEQGQHLRDQIAEDLLHI